MYSKTIVGLNKCLRFFILIICFLLVLRQSGCAENTDLDESKSDAFKQVGNYVTFGRYPQTAAGDDETPIEWLVLDYDSQNNKSLLISRFALDGQQYNNEHAAVTWETCTLRAWLNGEFLNRAFNSEEQAQILVTKVNNSFEVEDIKCSDTEDKVFLLNAEEAMHLFLPKDVENPYVYLKDYLRCYPTDYAKQQGIYVYHNTKKGGRSKGNPEYLGAVSWWLRSPGLTSAQAFFVLHSGDLVYRETVEWDDIAVRPAIWVDLSFRK